MRRRPAAARRGRGGGRHGRGRGGGRGFGRGRGGCRYGGHGARGRRWLAVGQPRQVIAEVAALGAHLRLTRRRLPRRARDDRSAGGVAGGRRVNLEEWALEEAEKATERRAHTVVFEAGPRTPPRAALPDTIAGLEPSRSSAPAAPARVPERPTLEGLEAKWSAAWEEAGTYRFDRAATREQIYSIDTPPPTVSGSLHVGHVFSYTHTDVIARFHPHARQGGVLPDGVGRYGLPTERRVQNYYGVRCDPATPYDPSFAPPAQPS